MQKSVVVAPLAAVTLAVFTKRTQPVPLCGREQELVGGGGSVVRELIPAIAWHPAMA
jgi:hypothetical protein